MSTSIHQSTLLSYSTAHSFFLTLNLTCTHSKLQVITNMHFQKTAATNLLQYLIENFRSPNPSYHSSEKQLDLRFKANTGQNTCQGSSHASRYAGTTSMKNPAHNHTSPPTPPRQTSFPQEKIGTNALISILINNPSPGNTPATQAKP
jgi:hypothetical protein